MMNAKMTEAFYFNGNEAKLENEELKFGDISIPIRNGIPQFVSDNNYSFNNFSKLRDNHSRLQLDSNNGTNHREKTILERTNWQKEYFKDKLILECGCGAGADTEILLKFGAQVIAVDLAGGFVAKENLITSEKLQIVQADIANLPLKENYFDIVFCHRVIQHTPDPADTLEHILKYVKTGGGVFVHSYAKSFWQLCRWKYPLRLITTKTNPETLYGLIRNLSRPLYKLSSFLYKFGKIGYYVNWFFIPFLNYSNEQIFNDQNDDFFLEYGIHDTFDALSPKYDKPLSIRTINKITKKIIGNRDYEIITNKAITLLRTKH